MWFLRVCAEVSVNISESIPHGSVLHGWFSAWQEEAEFSRTSLRHASFRAAVKQSMRGSLLCRASGGGDFFCRGQKVKKNLRNFINQF